MRRGAALLALTLTSPAFGCQADSDPTGEATPAQAAAPEVDPALLRDLLGEAVKVDGERVEADGLLVRLAFDPLIRQTGPVAVQRVQGQGYRLTGIADGSPLWLLGLRDGDVLTGVDEQAILGQEHALRSAYEARPRVAELTYMRGSEARTLRLEIAPGAAWRSTGGDRNLLARPGSLPRTAPRSSPAAVEQFAAGVRCVADDAPSRLGRCEVERAKLEALLDSPEALARSARVVPSLRDGEELGFKLYGIRRASIPHLLGFKNGDLLTRMSGQPLNSLDAAMTAYSTLRGATRVELELERKGTAMILELELVDALSGPPAPLGGADEPRGRRVSPDLKDPFAGPAADLQDPFAP